MISNDSDNSFEMSVLDRLLDDDPENPQEQRKTRAHAHQELLDAIRRDLEVMLNTRGCSVTWEPSLSQLGGSLLNYGIATVGSTVYSAAANRERFRDEVEQTIRRFEPRFLRVSVQLIDDPERLERTIRFRIEALVNARPAPEPLVFDSVMDLSGRGISVAAPHHV